MVIAVATHVFNILLWRRQSVQAGLEALAKKATRKGLTPVSWSWGKAVTSRERTPHPEYGWEVEHFENITRVPLTIEGDAPHFAGWTFVAALEHLDGENIIRAIGDFQVPHEYRTRGPVCDHCKAARKRNDTYLLQHTDGRIFQVGSTCIDDFLGADHALKLASQASMLAEARGIAEGGLEGGGTGTSGDVRLGEALEITAWAVRATGWVSRTKARESGDYRIHATADFVWDLLFSAKARKEAGCAPTDADLAEAAAAEAWAEALTDAEVDAAGGDYLHNLRAIARSGIVGSKSIGIGASMIVAYQRHLGRVRKAAERAARGPSDYVGTVGAPATFDAKLDFVTGYDSDYGYVTVCKYVTDAGAIIVWKAKGSDAPTRADVGKRYLLRGSVKKHDEYKGEKQTILTRAVVTDFDPAEYARGIAEDRRKALAAGHKAGTLTADEQAEWAAIKAAEAAARKAHRTEVAKFATFASTPEETANAVGYRRQLVTVDGTTITAEYEYYTTRNVWSAGGAGLIEHARIIVRRLEDGTHGYKEFKGGKALDNARKYIAELLTEKAAS